MFPFAWTAKVPNPDSPSSANGMETLASALIVTLTEPTLAKTLGSIATTLPFTPIPAVAPVPACPEGTTLASASVEMLPKEVVLDTPDNVKLASASKVTAPTAEVPTWDPGVTFAFPIKVKVPTALVPAWPVIFTLTLPATPPRAANGVSANALFPNIIYFNFFQLFIGGKNILLLYSFSVNKISPTNDTLSDFTSPISIMCICWGGIIIKSFVLKFFLNSKLFASFKIKAVSPKLFV